MDDNRKNSKKMLEAAVAFTRELEPDRNEMENGAARVWARISQVSEESTAPGEIRGCSDYRAMIPEYLMGRLSSARALLFKDHTYECVACRNALDAARFQERRGARASRPMSRERRWGRIAAVAAAAVVLALGVAFQQSYLNFLLPVVKVNAVARTIEGRLYRLSGADMSAVKAGDALKAGEPVRTGAESAAVIELADGTRIEMRERSQLSLSGAHDGVRIHLSRGSVIVEAAKQRGGRLYVATDDCTVSVVGTVLAVSAGVKGSRVSVIEGEVRVSQPAGTETALYPGQQFTSTPMLTAVPIEQDISWSRNVETHLALLRALADVNAFLRGQVPGPNLRYTSALAPLAPANTVMYAAFPNVSSTLGQAYDLFRQKINQNPALAAWWADRSGRGGSADATLEEMIEHVRTLGGYLGEEIAIAVTGSRLGPQELMILAGVSNASGAAAELKALGQGTSTANPLRVLTDPAQLASVAGLQGPIAYVGPSILVLASSAKSVDDVIAAQRVAGGSFTGRPFYASIVQAYQQGAGMLFAADLATLFSGAPPQAQFFGLNSVERLVVEQKQMNGATMTRAHLMFSGERQGAASWLAAPAPMGALEFISPQAYGVASVVTKDAATIFDELLGFREAFGGDGVDAVAEFEHETGLNVRRDLAEPLGGELLVALDGPFLPTPSWKLVVETYDPARLQHTIEQLVQEINRRAAERAAAAPTYSAEPAVTLSSEAAGGQVYYRLRRSAGAEVYYTYAAGYLIAAPSQGLVRQALQYWQGRTSIANSAKFRSLMPAGGTDHCSAILYQNLVEAAASVANYVPAGAGGLSSQQLQSLRQTIEMTPPTLVCAAGLPNQIVMGYQGDLAMNVLMLGGLRSMMETISGVR